MNRRVYILTNLLIYIGDLTMKQINVYFEDEEFEKINKERGDLTWREFIIKKVK